MIHDPKDLVDRCINCGFCEAVCPTLEANYFNAYYGARGRVNLAREYLNNGLTENDVKMSFDSCLGCNACLFVCPAGINVGEISLALKLNFKNKDPLARFIAKNIMKYRDPLNLKYEAVRWSEGLKFYQNSEDLFYTAKMFQLMPYNSSISRLRKKIGDDFLKNISKLIEKLGFRGKMLEPFVDPKEKDEFNHMLRNIYEILAESGLRMKYLGIEEPYSGAMLLELGMEKEFKEYANWLVNFFKNLNIKRIITVDPHTYSLLKYEIKNFVNFPFEVIFYLDLVNKNIRFEGKVTIHQACHLERYGDRYRNYLDLFKDVKILNPVHYNEKMLCCGGPDEILFPEISERISDKRFKELKGTGSDMITTMCPICFLNLKKDDSVVDISTFIINNSK